MDRFIVEIIIVLANSKFLHVSLRLLVSFFLDFQNLLKLNFGFGLT